MGRIIRKWMSVGILFLGGMLSLAQGMEEKERIEVVARIAPSVVAIFPPDGSGGGSGVVISEDGYVLTNFHVTQPCGAWMKCGLPGGEIFHAVLVGMDPVGDVALIKMYPPADWPEEKRKNWRWKPVVWGDSDQVRTGDSVLVLGNPFNFSTDFSP
ncbi:MAG: trypsin-like peptidase domain-containing protein, partial [Planctomycetia bacterium]|nr:trypsin-like peptidase domain-containing protein [Planctomycetia bacterium]